MKQLSLLLAIVMVAGCTKEKPFEFVPNKKTVSKNMFSKEDYSGLPADKISKLTPEEKKKYRTPRIAVMSYGQATRTATASMPYFQGRTKLVEYEVTEHAIEVRELEKDPRYADNPTNNKTIMVLPVRHVDYDCDRDAYGECQNKEVEDNKKAWQDRAYVEVNFEQSKILDTDELPVEITNLVSGCYSEGNQKLINYDLSKDVFNFEIQKSYSLNLANPECWGEIADFENLFEKLNFDVRYVYSMVRDDVLASKDYKKIEYKRDDENSFGFFTSTLLKLDVDNNPIENNDQVLMNRWSPDRKTIQYHLSDEFAKPENAYILDATKTAVSNVNNGLAQAGAGLQIELLPPSGKKVGDLRNNMIVLVEDPLASRIIGYGPSVAHPTTGEIVNARTVMYLGTIKGIVKSTYEEIREEMISEKEASSNVNDVQRVIANFRDKMNMLSSSVSLSASMNQLKELNSLQRSLSAANISDKVETLDAHVKMRATSNSLPSSAKVQQIKRDLQKFRKLESSSLLARESKYIDKKIDVFSKHNIYPADLFNAEFAMDSSGLVDALGGELKPWMELSEAEKESVIQMVLPHIWIPTLVHELGHNLGLRHNFAGSEDKENFYTPEELAKMGIEREIPYASMMEYSYKSTNELPTLGKYDVAALRYAYKREVEVHDSSGKSSFVKVKTNLAETKKDLSAKGLTLKDYGYCTDEHVSANPTCNRFDEGTNILEIANHFIADYFKNYKLVNKRNGRKNFSLFNEGGYLGRRANAFYFLRLTFELYERIKNDYGIPEGHSLWQSEEFLKQIYDASSLSGQFFLTVLFTPDTHCAISLAEEPRAPIALMPIRNLDAYATTCFHPDVQRTLDAIGQQNGGLNLIASGEGGKSFKSRKDPLNQNSYADQIDVQGIWVDKMLALEFLFARELGTTLFDSHTENYINHGGVGPHVNNILTSIILGRGAVNVEFRDQYGNKAKFLEQNGSETSMLPVSLSFGSEHNIDVPLIPSLSRYFGLPNEQTTYQREIVRTLGRLVPSNVHNSQASQFLDAYTVFREWKKLEGMVSLALGSNVYYAIPAQKVAYTAINSSKAAVIISAVTEEEVKALIELKKANQALPAEASEEQKAVYALDISYLEDAVSGQLKSAEFYGEVLSTLLVVR